MRYQFSNLSKLIVLYQLTKFIVNCSVSINYKFIVFEIHNKSLKNAFCSFFHANVWILMLYKRVDVTI